MTLLFGRHWLASCTLVATLVAIYYGVAWAKPKGLIYNRDGKFIYRSPRSKEGNIIIIEDRPQYQRAVDAAMGSVSVNAGPPSATSRLAEIGATPVAVVPIGDSAGSDQQWIPAMATYAIPSDHSYSSTGYGSAHREHDTIYLTPANYPSLKPHTALLIASKNKRARARFDHYPASDHQHQHHQQHAYGFDSFVPPVHRLYNHHDHISGIYSGAKLRPYIDDDLLPTTSYGHALNPAASGNLAIRAPHFVSGVPNDALSSSSSSTTDDMLATHRLIGFELRAMSPPMRQFIDPKETLDIGATRTDQRSAKYWEKFRDQFDIIQRRAASKPVPVHAEPEQKTSAKLNNNDLKISSQLTITGKSDSNIVNHPEQYRNSTEFRVEPKQSQQTDSTSSKQSHRTQTARV